MISNIDARKDPSGSDRVFVVSKETTSQQCSLSNLKVVNCMHALHSMHDRVWVKSN